MRHAASSLVTVDGTGASGAASVNLDKGVIVLAVPTEVVKVIYEEEIHESAQIDTNDGEVGVDDLLAALLVDDPGEEPLTVRVSPVELLN